MDVDPTNKPLGIPSFAKPQMILKISVGRFPNVNVYHVHQETLVSLSPWWSRQLRNVSGQLKGTREVQLDDVDCFVFGQFVHYLYRFNLEFTDIIMEGGGGSKFLQHRLVLFTQLWFVAGYYEMSHLQNIIMEALMVIIYQCQGTDALAAMYKIALLPEDGNMLERFALDHIARATLVDEAPPAQLFSERMAPKVSAEIIKKRTENDHDLLREPFAEDFFVEDIPLPIWEALDEWGETHRGPTTFDPRLLEGDIGVGGGAGERVRMYGDGDGDESEAAEYPIADSTGDGNETEEESAHTI